MNASCNAGGRWSGASESALKSWSATGLRQITLCGLVHRRKATLAHEALDAVFLREELAHEGKRIAHVDTCRRSLVRASAVPWISGRRLPASLQETPFFF